MKKNKFVTRLMIGILPFLFSEMHAKCDENSEPGSKKIEDCFCSKKDRCAGFFCECMPLFEGLVSSFTISFFLEPGGKITVPFMAENNGSISSGRIASVCTKPIRSCNQIIVPGGRLNFCNRCGWAKITFDGDFQFSRTVGVTPPPLDLIIRLKSLTPGLPDILLKHLTISDLIDNAALIHLYTEEVVDLNCVDNACFAPGYVLEMQNASTSDSIDATSTFLNARIMVEADGPCGCCPKSNMKE